MKKSLLFFISLIIILNSFCQGTAFKVVPLGVKGGSDESNLSSYMIAPAGSDAYVCLDAGTLHAGIQTAILNKVFKVTAAKVLRQNIKGYLISHGHLDHTAGLILNSPDDTSKNIYAMKYAAGVFKENYFTWKSWANFGDEGDKPTLNKYHYVILDSAKEISLANTTMFVAAFPLSHVNPYESTAFLIRDKENYLLYLGDTGPDEIERSDKLQMLWQYIAPLIKAKKLKVIFMECSFPDEQPDGKLFGHLTPKWLMKEMNKLAEITGKENLKNFSLVITHIKPSGNHEVEIKKQLAAENNLQLKVVYPWQGKMIKF